MPQNGNILLMNVCYSVSAVFGKYHFIPTGLLNIATLLETAGYNVKILDTRLRHFNLDYLDEQVGGFDPQVIGLSFMTDNFFTTRRLAALLRKKRPKATIILGGPHVSVADRISLEKIDADIVVRGEGEETMLELCRSLINGDGNIKAVKGITYRSAGKIKTNPSRPPPDPDKLPPLNFELLPDFKDNYSGTIITGRGCPYHCTFCAANNISPSHRARSVASVISEIKKLKEDYGINFFSFMDDTFVADPARVKELCSLFKEHFKPHEDLFWFAEGRANILAKDPALIPLMKEAGLVRLQLGVESANKEQLKAYKKQITTMQVETVVEQCRQNMVQVFCSFIIGGPFEDRTIEEERSNFIKKLIILGGGLTEINIAFLNPLPGTDIYDHPQKYGIRLLDPELLTSDYFNYCVARTSHMSREDIIEERYKIVTLVNSEILKQIPKTPKEVIDSLVLTYERCGIMHRTLLLRQLGKDLFKKMGSGFYQWRLGNKVYHAVSAVTKNEIGHFCPERNTIFLMEIKDGKKIVHAPLGSIVLEKFEDALFELSAGKLTFDEIIERLASMKTVEGERQKLFDLALKTYKRFEELELIQLREI